MRIICRLIWDFCETFHISLGRFAPYIFGGMIGRFPHKKFHRYKNTKEWKKH